jgi:hypothetical protein
MQDDIVELEGRIEQRPVAQGSKSARRAMVIVLPDGKSHLLRRAGGNALLDPALVALEGQTLRLRGRLRPGFFLVEALPAPLADNC